MPISTPTKWKTEKKNYINKLYVFGSGFSMVTTWEVIYSIAIIHSFVKWHFYQPINQVQYEMDREAMKLPLCVKEIWNKLELCFLYSPYWPTKVATSKEWLFLAAVLIYDVLEARRAFILKKFTVYDVK